MTSNRKSTEERREEIADAALRIIAMRGIAALTVAALASEVGLTGGALYRHFPSTEAILDAVAARVEALLDASLPSRDLAPLEWLRKFAESRTRAVGGHPGLLRVLFSDQVALALSPSALERLQGVVRRSRVAIHDALADGQARGEIRDDIDAAALTPIVMGALQMIAMHRGGTMLPRIPGEPMRLFDTLERLLAPSKSRGRR
jgi:AcrR family transcriptional regulator